MLIIGVIVKIRRLRCFVKTNGRVNRGGEIHRLQIRKQSRRASFDAGHDKIISIIGNAHQYFLVWDFRNRIPQNLFDKIYRRDGHRLAIKISPFVSHDDNAVEKRAVSPVIMSLVQESRLVGCIFGASADINMNPRA